MRNYIKQEASYGQQVYKNILGGGGEKELTDNDKRRILNAARNNTQILMLNTMQVSIGQPSDEDIKLLRT